MLDEEHRGKTLRCKVCQEPFSVPYMDAPAPIAVPVAVPLKTALTTTPGAPPAVGAVPVPDAVPAAELPAVPAASANQRSGRNVVKVFAVTLAALLLLGVALAGGGGYLAYRLFWPANTPPATTAEKNEGAEPEAGLAALEAIRPAPLKDGKATLTLPAPAAATCLGGGGRYLILHLPQQRQLAVFDANEAKIVKYLPVADDNVLIAAGATKLMVVLPEKHLVQRWDLTTFEKERTLPFPADLDVAAALMGNAADNHLVLLTQFRIEVPRPAGPARPIVYLDARTLKELPYRCENLDDFLFRRGGPEGCWISADGSVVSIASAPPWALVLRGNTIHEYVQGGNGWPGIPGADGRTLFSPEGLFSVEGRRLQGVPANGLLPGAQIPPLLLPAAHGHAYLSITGLEDPRFGGGGRPRVAVHLTGDPRPLAALDAVDGLDVPDRFARPDQGSLPIDKRVFLIPRAQLLATLSSGGDKLHLRHFDLDEALEKSGVDFLAVMSQPPSRFTPGKTLAYQLDVKSKKGGVKYKLESGPEGMTLSPAGRLEWKTPEEFEPREADVIISVTDGSGQEINHCFRLVHADGPKVARNDAGRRPDRPRDDLDPFDPRLNIRPPFEMPRPPDQDEPPNKPGPQHAKGAPLVRPATTSMPIKAPALKDEPVTLNLPSRIDDVCVGGGGRFLIFFLAKERRLAIFDTNEAKIVKYLPVAEDRVLIAAGMDKLLVVLPDRRLVQRWSLVTFEKELTTSLPPMGEITLAVMGSATNGPLVLAGADDFGRNQAPFTFIDVPSMKEVWVERVTGDFHGLNVGGPNLRISANGRVMGSWRSGVSPSGLQSLTLSGNTIRAAYEHNSVGSVLPSPDGRILYTYDGRYTSELKRIGDRANAFFALPSVQGSYCVAPALPDDGIGDQRRKKETTIHIAGDARPIATLGGLDLFRQGDRPWERDPNSSPLPVDQRVFLIPAAKMLAVIPWSGDKLVLYRFDLDEALEKSGVDFLVAASEPVISAVKGREYVYPIVVKSKQGKVKFKLESGPRGMSVSGDGKLTWNVPADFAEAKVDVLLTIGDASGQEIFHSFEIHVKEKDGADKPPDAEDRVGRPENKPVTVKTPPAPPRTPGIKAAPLDKDRVELSLPASAGEVCAAGAGRFLILHLPAERKLAVFDSNEAKVVKYLPLPGDSVRVAAGADFIMVHVADSNVFQRWSLKTFEKEATVPSPLRDQVTGLAMGSATRGPLVVMSRGDDRFGESNLALLDPVTFKPSDVELDNRRDGADFRFNERGGELHVSADGRLITGPGAYVRRDNKYVWTAAPASALPGSDGETFYTPGTMFGPDGRRIGPMVGGHGHMVWYVPALQGKFHVSLNQVGAQRGQSSLRVGFHVAGQGREVASLPGLDPQEGLVDWQIGQTRAFEQHVFLIPDARLLAVMPAARDKLVLHRLDLDKMIEQSEADYLFVQSPATAEAVKGDAFSYPVAARSKRGGVTLKLEDAPAGMKATPEGQLVWDVPADFKDKTADVLLSVADASGQEVYHSLRVAVKDAAK
jgi:hypothetical protein